MEKIKSKFQSKSQPGLPTHKSMYYNDKQYFPTVSSAVRNINSIAMRGISPQFKEFWALLLNSIQSQASDDFKDNQQMRVDLYNGRYEQHLLDAINDRYVENKSLKLQLQNFNITKMLVDNLSVIYKGGASRSLYFPDNDEQKPTPDDDKIFEYITQKGQFDLHMAYANKMINLCRTILIKPWFDTKKGIIRFRILLPSEVDFIPDELDPTTAIAVIYRLTAPTDENYLSGPVGTTASSQERYALWTDEAYREYTQKQGFIEIQTNLEGVNPYGRLPYVKMTDTPVYNSFWVDGGYDLVDAHINLALKITELNNLVYAQCFSQLILKGWKGDAKQNIVMGPNVPIIIPADDPQGEGTGQNAFYISPSPAIQQILDCIQADVDRLAEVYGISINDFKLTGSPASGYALELQNMHHTDRRKCEKPYYESAESEIFEIVKLIWNYHSQFLPDGHSMKGKVFSEGIALRTIIREPNIREDEETLLTILEKEKSAGLSSYLMRVQKYHGVEREEAIDIINRIEQDDKEHKPPKDELEGLNPFGGGAVPFGKQPPSAKELFGKGKPAVGDSRDGEVVNDNEDENLSQAQAKKE
jgi:hypothetical protein